MKNKYLLIFITIFIYFLFYLFNYSLEILFSRVYERKYNKEYFNSTNYNVSKKDILIYNKIIKKIVNVYQLNPKNGYIQGYADFIKGTILILILCTDNNLLFDVDYTQHPISKYLINNNNEKYKIDYDNIERNPNTTSRFDHQKLIEFVRNLNKCNKPIYFTYCSEHPYREMTNKEKNIIISKFTPNNILLQNINNTLKRLKLEKKKYDVLHIRAGDEFLLNKKVMDNKKFNKIVLKIKQNINTNNKYLLLTDNNDLKIKLSNIFRNFIYETNEMVHSSLSNNYDNDGLKNTLTDYFLISLSKNVICICGYPHGSGFSEYCCKIYNIPYNYVKL